LQDLLKYHRIDITVEIDHMSGNEISRMIDKIIFQYGRIPEKCEKTGIDFGNAGRMTIKRHESCEMRTGMESKKR